MGKETTGEDEYAKISNKNNVIIIIVTIIDIYAYNITKVKSSMDVIGSRNLCHVDVIIDAEAVEVVVVVVVVVAVEDAIDAIAVEDAIAVIDAISAIFSDFAIVEIAEDAVVPARAVLTAARAAQVAQARAAQVVATQENTMIDVVIVDLETEIEEDVILRLVNGGDRIHNNKLVSK